MAKGRVAGAGQGGLVYLAGILEETTGDIPTAWAWVFVPPAVLLILAALCHHLVLRSLEVSVLLHVVVAGVGVKLSCG